MTKQERIELIRFKIFIDFIENNEVFKAKVKAKLIAKGRNPDAVFQRGKKIFKGEGSRTCLMEGYIKVINIGKRTKQLIIRLQ